jgi:4-amino-4-deoxy-L-arabinose transferase-like glycosyltransferase
MTKLNAQNKLEDGLNYFNKQPKLAWRLSVVWLILINSIAFIWHLGNTGLVDETEPLFAEASRQLLIRDDWITPYFNGETRFDKPILIYWSIAIGYKLIGVNEWAVRLPSAIAAIALTVFVFYTLRYFGFSSPKLARIETNNIGQLWFAAWVGAAIVTFNLEHLIWGRTGVSDMLLSGCIGSSLLCFFWGYVWQEKLGETTAKFIPNKWYISFYVLVGLAVLTKGPIGIVLPGLIIVVFVVYLGKFQQVVKEIGVPFGLLIIAVICLPWYILVTFKNGDAFINSFFGYHNVERFTSVVNGHSAGWYFYFLIILGLFFPWSIYLPLAIARIRFWQINYWRQQPRFAQLSLFAFIWFACIFIFFSISITKLPSYILPLIPAASILVTLIWEEKKVDNKWFLVSAIANITLSIGLSIAFILSPYLVGKDPAIGNLSELLKQSYLPWIGAIIWGINGLAISAILINKKSSKILVWCNIIAFILFIILVLTPTTFLLDTTRQLHLREMAGIIARQPEQEIWMIGFKKPTVVFYSHRQIKFFTNNKLAISYIQQTPYNSINQERILVLFQSKFLRKLNLQPEDYQTVEKKGVYQLVTIAKDKMWNISEKSP